MKRNKPIFLRQGWNRYIRLGKQIKKKRKWRHAGGGDSKTRLKERGKPARPTIGWGSAHQIRGKIAGLVPVRVESLAEFAKIQDKETHGVIIASVGRKKRVELTKKANDMGLKILNKYKMVKENAVK